MIYTKTLVLTLFAVASIVGLGGCSSKAASPDKASPRRVPPENAPGSPAPSRTPEPAAKLPARELAFATYSNPEYGLTVRYPRNFGLVEAGDASEATLDDASGARSQEELQSAEPGAVLLATVTIPADAYPNTTFSGGSLQFVVNRYLTAGTCQSNLITRLGDSNGTTGTVVLHGVPFSWLNNDSGDGRSEFFERDYAGFANQACYEFFLRVGVGSASDAGPAAKPLDEKRRLGNLDKIVASSQFDAKATSALDRNVSAPGERGKL
jgi:hypothetical protein